jgi:spore maturation protein CgeB
MSARLQERFRLGPRIDRLNAGLLRQVRVIHPDAVVLFRGDKVMPQTVREIRSRGVRIVAYNNDDPFSTRYPKHVWRYFLESVPLFDHIFAYRHRNIADYYNLGAQKVSLLRSFYLRDDSFPLENPERVLDVSFVGHWEDDSRNECVEAILGATGIRFRLWGGNWHLSPMAGELRRRWGRTYVLDARGYNDVLNQSKISLVFLSSLNNDTYTRRCFEIPAAGGFMLAPFTEDLASLYQEGIEAEFFRSPAEMLDKIRFYLGHEEARASIAYRGRQRLLRDGHEALDRALEMREVIRHIL